MKIDYKSANKNRINENRINDILRGISNKFKTKRLKINKHMLPHLMFQWILS